MHYFPTLIMWPIIWYYVTSLYNFLPCDYDYMTLSHMILSHTLSLCSKSRKEKTKKRNINNNLAILPSHNNYCPFDVQV